jgi:hypothetical protein
LVSPPLDLHLSIGEGLSDACGAASGGADESVPPLPSAVESGPEVLLSGVLLPDPPLSSAPDPGPIPDPALPYTPMASDLIPPEAS